MIQRVIHPAQCSEAGRAVSGSKGQLRAAPHEGSNTDVRDGPLSLPVGAVPMLLRHIRVGTGKLKYPI